MRSSLYALADRAQRGDLEPLTGVHRYTPEAAENFRSAAVLALLTPTISARETPTVSAQDTPTLSAHHAPNTPAGAPGTEASEPAKISSPAAGLQPTSGYSSNDARTAARAAAEHPTGNSAEHPAQHAHPTEDPAGPGPSGPVGADLFLVQRSPWLRHHPGQIALPGGALESCDAGPEAAALRETEEETGISSERVEVLGRMPSLLLPISSFVVTPVLGWAAWVPPVTEVDQGEVLHTLRVPVDSLLDPQRRSTIVHGEHTSPGFRTETGWVWGFTGSLLDHLFTQLGWARPWDASVRYTMSWDEARGAQLLDP